MVKGRYSTVTISCPGRSMLHVQLYIQPQLYLTNNTVFYSNCSFVVNAYLVEALSYEKESSRETLSVPANFHVKYLLFLCSVNENRKSSTYVSKNLKCKISRKSVRVIDLIQADRWKNGRTGMTKLTVAFHLLRRRKIWLRRTKLKK